MTLESTATIKKSFNLAEFCNPLNCQIELTLEPALVDRLYQMLLKKKAKETKIQGFRPGKAPISWVESRHQQSLQLQAIEQAAQLVTAQALRPYRAQLFRKPQLIESPHQHEKSGQYVFKIAFEKLPDIQLSRLSGYKLHIVKPNLDEAALDQVIEQLRYEQSNEFVTSNDPVQWGDQILLNRIAEKKTSGKKNSAVAGKSFPKSLQIHLDQALKYTGQALRPVTGYLLPTENILGATLGQTIRLPLESPQADLPEKLAFSVVEVTKKVPAPITKPWIQALGIASGELAMLRSHLLEHLELQIDQKLSFQYKNHLIDAVLQTHPSLAVPFSSFLDALTQLKTAEKSGQITESSSDPDKQNPENPIQADQTSTAVLEEASEEERWMAYRRSASAIIFQSLIQKYELTVTQAAVLKLIARYSQLYEYPEKTLEQLMGNQAYVAQIHQHLLEEEVLKLAGNHWQVEVAPCDLETFFSSRPLIRTSAQLD